MGESRGGEGRAEGPTTDLIARALSREYEGDGRETDQIHVQYLTEGLYAVSVVVRGENTPERYFLRVDDQRPSEPSGSPSGGSEDPSREV